MECSGGGRGRSRTHQPPQQQLNGFEGRTLHRERRSSAGNDIKMVGKRYRLINLAGSTIGIGFNHLEQLADGIGELHLPGIPFSYDGVDPNSGC